MKSLKYLLVAILILGSMIEFSQGANCTDNSNNCKDCLDDGKTCSSCDPLSDNKYLDTGKCESSCPNDKPANISNICNTCTALNCKTCFFNSSKCDSCNQTSTNKLLSEGNCVSECPAGKISNTKQECVDCSASSCKICSDDLTKCDTCDDGKYLDEGKCLTECPDGKRKKGKECVSCIA
jgi:proprotein convertase subtilisin/kexin type 5